VPPKKKIIYKKKWGGVEGLGGDDGGDITNIQYKSNPNGHYESPPYNEYTLIKNY
jgi:hypothetical protein